MKIPSLLLRQLYTFGSLENTAGGFRFGLRNRLSDVTLTRLVRLRVDGEEIPLGDVRVDFGAGHEMAASEITTKHPVPFPLRQNAHLEIKGHPLDQGSHDIKLTVEAGAFGQLEIAVKDALHDPHKKRATIPYEKDAELNYGPKIIAERHKFLAKATGHRAAARQQAVLRPRGDEGEHRELHRRRAGADRARRAAARERRARERRVPHPARHHRGDARRELQPRHEGAQPRRRRHLHGERRLHAARAGVRLRLGARGARLPRLGQRAHRRRSRRRPKSTSSVAKLLYIDTFLASKFAFLRFNFSTGDAAGQNMTGRATFAACSWILEQHTTIRRFYLESNFATDKKASQVNVMRTRGKRVTAEATIPREVLVSELRVEPESLHYHARRRERRHAALGGEQQRAPLARTGSPRCSSPPARTSRTSPRAPAGIIYTGADEGPATCTSRSPSRRSSSRRTAAAPTLPTQRECLRDPRLRRQGEGQQARRDRGGRGARGRDLARGGDLVARMGELAREVRPEPLT